MRENKLRARTKRKFKRTTDSEHALPIAKNLLRRDFDESLCPSWTRQP